MPVEDVVIRIEQTMKNIQLLFVVAICALVLGCQISDSGAKVTKIGERGALPKKFIIIGDTEFEGELTASCAERGVQIKPLSTRQKVTEIESPGRIVEYKEAGYRYALKLNVRHDTGKVCVFSGNHFVDVTMAVIDIETNESLLIIRQSGPLGACPPLKPVWDLLADALAKQL